MLLDRSLITRVHALRGEDDKTLMKDVMKNQIIGKLYILLLNGKIQYCGHPKMCKFNAGKSKYQLIVVTAGGLIILRKQLRRF